MPHLTSLGLNSVYVPFAVQNLAQAVQGLRGLNLGGVSVTIPFKEEIIPLLDEIDDQARIIGAVNTVVNREGRLWGTNTDWQGALAALQEEIDSGRATCSDAWAPAGPAGPLSMPCARPAAR